MGQRQRAERSTTATDAVYKILLPTGLKKSRSSIDRVVDWRCLRTVVWLIIFCAIAPVYGIEKQPLTPEIRPEIFFAQPPTIYELSGDAQIMRSGSSRWQALRPEDQIAVGDKIRTAAESYAEIVYGADPSTILKIGPGSEIVLTQNNEWTCGAGVIYYLCEKESSWLPKDDGPDWLRFQAEGIKGRARSASLRLEVTAQSTQLRVFDGKVDIYITGDQGARAGTEAMEGYKYTVYRRHPKEVGVLRGLRMTFEDYADWQIWIRKVYRRKDAEAIRRA